MSAQPGPAAHLSLPPPLASTHPKRPVVGRAEDFGLVWRGDDCQGIDGAHVAREGPHLLLGLDVPHLREWHRQVGTTDGGRAQRQAPALGVRLTWMRFS